MCKSELSACFSRLLDPQNTNSPLTHGCLDSLASTADICQARQARNHSGSPSPSLECCHEDMMLRSENRRLQEQRQQMLSRLHYSFHGQHSKKGQVAKLDLECMVPVSGHENCCLTCDKMRQADLSHDRILSLVHWGMYSGHGKLE
ncbi:BAMBI, partial [Cervus elaphus hippelaphus]